MNPVQEKIDLFNLLYSSQRIKESRNEILKKPAQIWLALRGNNINTFMQDNLSVQIAQFSSQARQHFIKVLEEGHVYRELDSQLVMESIPVTSPNKITVFFTAVNLFIVMVSIYWIFTLSNAPIEIAMKVFCLFSTIYCGRSLILSIYDGVLFLYLRQKNLALLKSLD